MKQFTFSLGPAFCLALQAFYKNMLMVCIPNFIFVFKMFICYYV